ncbi:hypothetical protein EVT38_24405 [Salmonella enterica subsp. enterica serovar Java]|uniref:Uncharacterized protein n=4 Tax=Salmonella enterica TaxID=28901 RepID=A0A3Y0D9T4_SALEB|nr:hypothetical protein [Salmonella enterica subsp. enterica serovar Java]EAN8111298.1 hypothetical protein [Salmonella enterica]EAW1753887.1 hypothetical protein [Salmonella enterica subsp. enterica]ECA3887134.1 hypothetical protein [Salmonella enterica subsp. enterica serovar Infantis]EDE1997824.1 hypothetical protein [Salmonella enterica subsp. enterica serovar Hissar]EDQ7331046.1 hypothetical protein [Salmonella enterica subsp. enterica serovar Paratyphi C]EEJ2325157.1 hypothetical protei
MNAPAASYPISSGEITGCQARALPPESAVTECLLATCPGDSKNYASRRDYAASTVLAPLAVPHGWKVMMLIISLLSRLMVNQKFSINSLIDTGRPKT